MNGESCCAPAKNSSAGFVTPDLGQAPNAGSRVGMVKLESTTFLMGGEGPETWATDREGPVREASVETFWIARTCVTNDEFSEFVAATGYQTEAEKFGWSFVFLNQIPKAHRRQDGQRFESVNGLNWWVKVGRADWRKPGGPGTNIKKLGEHPVVHLSWNDASTYATWRGKRLPTETEWEFASRGGLEQAIYPWGDELTPDGKHRCNIWQGSFPDNDTGEDGYTATAPAKSFRANGYGLYNTSGNVWEWCADRWHPGDGRVIRGGSYLCHASYCNRYRVSARSSNTPDSSTCHTGVRLAMSASAESFKS